MGKFFYWFIYLVFTIQCAHSLSLEKLKYDSIKQRAKIFYNSVLLQQKTGKLNSEEFQFFESLYKNKDLHSPNAFWNKSDSWQFQGGILEAYKNKFGSANFGKRKSFIEKELLKSSLAFTYQELGYETKKIRSRVPRNNEPFPDALINIDIKSPHTLEVDKYLRNRLSKPIIDALRTSEFIDFYIGPQKELLEFYRFLPIVEVSLGRPKKLNSNIPSSEQASELSYRSFLTNKGVKLKTALSNSFYVFQLMGERDDFKVDRTLTVISDIPSKAKLADMLIRLKFLNIDLGKVRIFGTFDYLMRKDKSHYVKYIQNKTVKPKILFLGPRWDVVQFFVHFADKSPLYKVESREGEWFGDSDDPSLDNVFKLNYQVLLPEKPGIKPFAVLSAKMPNGDSSGDFLKLAMDNGIKYVVAAGAGGSLTTETQMGSLQVFQSATLNRITETVSQNHLIKIDNPFEKIPGFKFLPNGKNLTVLSPLEETKDWLEYARANFSVVDVESYYILKTFNDYVRTAKCRECKILPTLFISDVVGEHPLEEKIGGGGAWKQIKPFMEKVLESVMDQISK